MTTIKEQLNQLRAIYGAKSARTLKPTRCPHCKAIVLTGLDEDACAFAVTVDPTPLSTQGEGLAVLLGIPTHHLRRVGAGTTITRRGRWNRASNPPGTRGLDVVAEHTCTRVTLPTLDAALPQPSAASREDDQPCPY